MTNDASRKPLPGHLRAAYDWTYAAGAELDELRRLSGSELERYCRESAENFRDNPSGAEVTEAALRELHDWPISGEPSR